MSKERSFQNQFKGLMLYRCWNCKLLVISQTTDFIILPHAHLHFHFHRWRVVLEYPVRPVDICSNHEDFQNFFRWIDQVPDTIWSTWRVNMSLQHEFLLCIDSTIQLLELHYTESKLGSLSMRHAVTEFWRKVSLAHGCISKRQSFHHCPSVLWCSLAQVSTGTHQLSNF